MIITLFYTLSILSLIVGTAAIYLAMIESVPVSWLYHHYFIRKPLNWSILLFLLSWSSLIYFRENQWPLWTLPPIIIALFALILTYKMHQEKAFPSVFFPEMSDKPYELPIDKLIDQLSETHWNMFGKYLSGSIQADLDPIAVSDEYWFSWKKFHEDTEVIMDFD